ncbi:MAG: hypothetical protein EWV40_01075 [Microcystis flos-aquae Mf_WU_F_19750830_S460]|uniref:Uncharacterized protein n=1 Tax=Microcystis flos-aquae Mf_WU_F_19750830_S460 TaxID=2486237 RepID=A0A552M4E8_9CHRO|nr:MAG: hypothetical protein EWV40_01075 [Microcystis flos-aquae Mf_WU_F_19750830_S460]
MKKFSPPQMKEVSFPTPHTPHPTPHTPHPTPCPREKLFAANPSYSPAIAPRAIDAIACSVARGR